MKELVEFERVLGDNIMLFCVKDWGIKKEKVMEAWSTDDFLKVLEENSGELSIVFGPDLPEDILPHLSGTESYLKTMEGVKLFEIAGTSFFNTSVKADLRSSLKKELFDVSEKTEHKGTKLKGDVVTGEVEGEPISDRQKEEKFVEHDSKNKEVINKGEVAGDTEDGVGDNNSDNEEKSFKLLEKEKNRLFNRLNELQIDYDELQIDLEAKEHVLSDKVDKLNRLSKEYDEITEEKNRLEYELNDLKNNQISEEELESLKVVVKEKEDQLAEKIEEVRREKITKRSFEEEKDLAEAQYKRLEEDYKKLLKEGVVNYRDLDKKYLNESGKDVLYFKVYNQPMYFKSFVSNLKELLAEKGEVLTIVFKDEDMFTKEYFKDFEVVSNTEEIVGEDNVIITPSKTMFSNNRFLDKYKYIIVVDYVRVKSKFISGDDVTTINTFMQEREKDMLGIEGGLILSGGENSIVDLRYNEKYESANTFIRNRHVRIKVNRWLETLGL